MRQILAAVILGGALAVTASAAFAGDDIHSQPVTPTVSPVVLLDQSTATTDDGMQTPANRLGSNDNK